MEERPVVRGRMWQGTSSKRKRRRCKTTKASISGYSRGKLWRNTSSARRLTPTKPEVGSCTGLPRTGRSTRRKKRMPSERTGAGTVVGGEAGADHHFGAGRLERLENAENIAGVVLPIAIHADDELISEFPGEFVSGLHAAADTEMVGHGQHVGAGLTRHGDGAIGRTIVDHHHRNAGNVLVDVADHVADGALLVEGGHDDEQGVGGVGGGHRAAVLRAVME